MTLGLSVCWRGPPGAGKRRALQQQLQLWAKSIGQFYVLKRQHWDAPIQGGGEDDSDEKGDEKALLPMESSILHWGFDVARMSLQDKQYVKSILSRWGRGSQVLSTAGHSHRCLVFYHAHLLSSESILFLQAFLEENSQDTVLWLTSEHPLPARLSDWCVEIPMKGQSEDEQARTLFQGKPFYTLEDEICMIYRHWMTHAPTLSDVKKIRNVVYGLLHRNIRWTDGFHQWMFALETLPLTPEQKMACARICIEQPFTGSGQTVPSYRIPILWENYLCRLREALAPAVVEQLQETPTQKVKTNRKKK